MAELEETPRVPAAYTKRVGANVRAAMENADPKVRQADVAEWLHLSQGAVWKRLEGLTPWTIGELIVVANTLGLPLGGVLLDGVNEALAA